MNRMTIRTTFCAQSKCSESAFERRFFWRGLYRHAVPLALLIEWLHPAFFRDDKAFVEYVGGDDCLGEVHEDISRFEYGNRIRQHWLRTGLRIRVNSARIAALVRQMWIAETPASPGGPKRDTVAGSGT
jgi:hypothetical protein